jgi:hypothetical protein
MASWFQFSAQSVDATLATVGHRVTLGGVASAGFAWLLSSKGAAFVGIVGVFGGLFIQWYFQRRRDRREQDEHNARMGMYR